MTFCNSHTNSNGLTILDGYSNAKTLKGALKDLSREVAKITESESHFTDFMEDTIAMLNIPHGNEWFIEYEEVACASQFNDNTEEMEYKNGNFYLCIGFVA